MRRETEQTFFSHGFQDLFLTHNKRLINPNGRFLDRPKLD
jgi:hypothetical protein